MTDCPMCLAIQAITLDPEDRCTQEFCGPPPKLPPAKRWETAEEYTALQNKEEWTKEKSEIIRFESLLYKI